MKGESIIQYIELIRVNVIVRSFAMGDLKFDRHIEVKDTRLANTSDIDEKLSLNTYSTVSDISMYCIVSNCRAQI